MKRVVEKGKRRIRRKKHIRKSISGTAVKPRMTVFRSSRNMYVQVIDDNAGHTLASVGTLEGSFKDFKNNVENAGKIGEAIGDKLKALKISTIVFDRNGYLYHGIVKSIADGARKSGIKF
ncbi:MAG: 50S ribosomal protein L18 [Spirochaetia bacterium]|jgi:large subunit ribosomal protein L18|nr:50S ribosomal protein L18 [Spirochaetia bacterium]